MKKRNWLIVCAIILVCFIGFISSTESGEPRWSCPIALQYNGMTYYGGWEIPIGNQTVLEISGEKVTVPWLDAEHLVQVGVVSKAVDISYMPEQDLACNLGHSVSEGTPVYQMVVRGEYMYVIDFEWKTADGTLNQVRHFFRAE